MSRVGGAGGGGKGGRVGGPKGGAPAAGAGKVGKASGYGKVDRAESLVGPSGEVAGGNVGAMDPLSPVLLEIARQLKAGQLTREEANKKLVATILEDRLRLKSKALTEKIAQLMEDDPRLNQMRERVWEKG